MFKMGRNESAEADETDAKGAPANAPAVAPNGLGSRLGRLTISPFSIGTQVAALVVIGVLMISGLALIGESRLASSNTARQAERTLLDTDRTDVTVALAAAQRAEATSSGFLDAFGRAGENVVSGRSSSAAADLAERSLTDFAQSLLPLDAAVRAFGVATAKSVYLRAWDETTENAQEAAFIKTNRDRIATLLKNTQELPGALAGVVIDNQEMTAALRSGNVADARDLYLTRQAPKIAAVDQSLRSLRGSLIDFSVDLAARHASLSRATDSEAEDRYGSQRASMRLQILLLMLVLCAGGALIAIYGLAIPLADLTAAASRFAEGRFEVPTTVLGRRDEIGRLSRALERIRETVSSEKKTEDQAGRDDREAKDAERLERATIEREVQQLRRDRERLERERDERDQADAARTQTEAQVSPEALEAERAQLRTELSADADRRLAEANAAHKKALDAAQADIARLKAELEKKPAPAPAPTPDPAHREALTKAETDIARLKIETERQKATAAAQAKTHQDALAKAQAETTRLNDELQKLRNAPPAPVESPAQREALAKAQAEIARLTDEVAKLRTVPAPVSPDKTLRETLNQARTEIARLKNEQTRERNVAKKAAQDAGAALDSRIAKITAEAQAERDRLAAERDRLTAAAQAAGASDAERARLATELALEKQTHEDDVATLRATHVRQMTEMEHRLSEQQADRLQVLAELTNSFESSVANTVAAVQAASHNVTSVSERIDDATKRAGQYRDEISSRVGRATASIHTAAQSADKIAAAFDEMAEQLALSNNAASGATVSGRAAIDAVQALEAAASRMNEVSTAIVDIAERTNVLSLNASIEAAKAGESGKGFVVVAAEIKSLANRAGRTGKEISDRIKAVSTATGSVRAAFSGVNLALGEIEGLVGKTSRAAAQQGLSARSIANGIQTAVDSADGVSRSVGETISSVEASARVVAQAQSAINGLNAQAQELRRQVDEFLAAIRAV